MGWLNEQIKCLLGTCLEEINRVGRQGGSMHKEPHTKLGKVLKERFGIYLTQKHMRNGYDNLRAKYLGYVYLWPRGLERMNKVDGENIWDFQLG